MFWKATDRAISWNYRSPKSARNRPRCELETKRKSPLSLGTGRDQAHQTQPRQPLHHSRAQLMCVFPSQKQETVTPVMGGARPSSFCMGFWRVNKKKNSKKSAMTTHAHTHDSPPERRCRGGRGARRVCGGGWRVAVSPQRTARHAAI